MKAIVICTVGSKSIHVLLESIKQYAKEIPVYVFGKGYDYPNEASNFGDAYNNAITTVFEEGYSDLIIANDDVVLTPDTIKLLGQDWQVTNEQYKVGLLGARSDYVLYDQNIRFPASDDSVYGIKYLSEDCIKQADVIAPIFAVISREAWSKVKFPSINWYSDNIICNDLTKLGYYHFVSRAYVHHAGSQTIGIDYEKCAEEPREWIKQNRPDVYGDYYPN